MKKNMKTRNERIFVGCFTLMSIFLPQIILGQFSGNGDGSFFSPYEIWTAEDLNLVRDYTNIEDVYFKQMADIDLTEYLMGSEKGWVPIGSYSNNQFKGVYDGNNFKITGLWINANSGDQGLFGWVSGEGSVLKNLTVITDNEKGGVTTTGNHNGILVGSFGNNDLIAGSILNCKVSGKVKGNYNLGALAGQAVGTIENCHAENVFIEGNNYNVAGFIGLTKKQTTNINNCSVNGATIKAEGNCCSGFIGSVETGASFTLIDNCNVSNVEIITTKGQYHGGFIGTQQANGRTTSCTVSDIRISEGQEIGGMIGRNMGQITNSHVYNATITSSTGLNCGGFIGYNTDNAVVGYCSARADVTIGTGSAAGGFVGWQRSAQDINNCQAYGNIKTAAQTGGFVGTIEGTASINNCSFIGKVEGKYHVGGFAAKTTRPISNSYAIADIVGDSIVGGFVGLNNGNPELFECYSSGNIAGNSNVGGFIGKLIPSADLSANISLCYSHSNITATNNNIGGFIGNIAQGASNINNSYWIGNIENTPALSVVGSFVGYNEGNVTLDKNYILSQEALSIEGNGNNPTGVTPLEENQLKSQSSYADFNFGNFNWAIWEDNSYPYFNSQSAPMLVTDFTDSSINGKCKGPVDKVMLFCNYQDMMLTSNFNELDWQGTFNPIQENDVLLIQTVENGKSASYPVLGSTSSGGSNIKDLDLSSLFVNCYFDPSGNLQFTGDNTIKSISIIDLTGKVILNQHLASDVSYLQTGRLSPGAYLIKIAGESEIVVKKVIKNK